MIADTSGVRLASIIIALDSQCQIQIFRHHRCPSKVAEFEGYAGRAVEARPQVVGGGSDRLVVTNNPVAQNVQPYWALRR